MIIPKIEDLTDKQGRPFKRVHLLNIGRFSFDVTEKGEPIFE